MPTRFKSTYNTHEAFYARADLLREMFGHWDCDDPVSHCRQETHAGVGEPSQLA
jgi:hypothetical protein